MKKRSNKENNTDQRNPASHSLLRPIVPFEQEQDGGNLSPLRGSIDWDEVHEKSLSRSRSRRKNPPMPYILNNHHHSRSLDATRTSIGAMPGGGHNKCYYEKMESVVRTRLAGLMITVAEEELAIERQR